MPRPLLATVVLCTHNRAVYLERALRSLFSQSLDPDSFEILVVDNRSTDRTRAVVEAFSERKGLRYHFEPALGLCHARNAGWRRSRGRYVAFLDDDAVAGPSWIQRIVELFERTLPRPGCIGGPIIPIWEAPRPAWLTDNLAKSLTVVDWQGGPQFLSAIEERWLAGANFSFPKEILEKLGDFTERLDRSGTALLSNGDILMERLVLRAGFQCLYHPDVWVRHHVQAARLNKSWLKRRYFYQGISAAVMQMIEEAPSPLWRLSAARSAAADAFRESVTGFFPWSGSEGERLERTCGAAYHLGRSAGWIFWAKG